MTICKICGKKTDFWNGMDHPTQGMSMHYQCREEFLEDPQKYGGLTPKELETETEEEKIERMLKNDSSQSEERSINLKNNNTGSAITRIDLSWGNAFFLVFQFLVVINIIMVPIFLIFMIVT